MADEYRITFFFGPEAAPDRPGVVRCVFNVKKRSWKGGVQVTVELAAAQLERIRDRGQLGELIEMIRAKVEPETFAEYELRARDLFTQQACWAKLDLAVRAGITQENQTISAEAFQPDLDEQARAQADAIRQAILTELDI
jgi:ubiquinone biosynthesis protein UbiJ